MSRSIVPTQLTECVVMGLAILGPSPSYEYPNDQLLHVVGKE